MTNILSTNLRLTLDLANRIMDLRLERGWSQDSLGQRIGATGCFVANLEAGLVSPTVKMLERLAAAFEAELRVELG